MNSIISPIITEKSMKDAAAGKFSFRVNKVSNKNEIKRDVEKNFNVNVVGISTNIVKGRSQRVGMKRSEKKISDFKKAVVTLKSGEKIGLFELGDSK